MKARLNFPGKQHAVWRLASLAALGALLAAADIQVFCPPEGTPRDPAQIVRLSDAEFRVLAGGEAGETHFSLPVSRVELVCRNPGPGPRDLTLHLDLSSLGTRTNAQGNAWAAMPSRDYLFVQRPGADWVQLRGQVEGWVCSATFSIPPGETKIGLSPWYTWADLQAWLRALPDHPHLRRASAGVSDGGRDHWELTITDPAVPESGKQRVFWHAREHAFETFSSFAMEGLVGFLLSPEAAEARRRFVFTLHAMSNPDGVAEGTEYRGGYELHGLRSTASGRLALAAVDRLRPHYVITWHNWIAPRDVDTLFYTDAEGDRPTRRAWDLFTQRFPSPRAVGHRWESESDPVAKNWFGRPLSDDNLHQYAMRHHGSRVWGWEMPWWGRTVADARRLGAAFARAWLATLEQLDRPGPDSSPEAPDIEVPLWTFHEFRLRGSAVVGNPWREAMLLGEFTAPSGRHLSVPGFFVEPDDWRLRFTPDEPGIWHYRLRGEGGTLFAKGRVRALPSAGHGFIRPHPRNPHAFAHADGTAFFPLGDTAYGLFSDSTITPALRAEYLRVRRAQRFNFVRVGVLHSPTHGRRDPRFWPWGGTPEAPDLDRFNPAYFEGLDRFMRELAEAGMNVELILLNFYQAPFHEPDLWTPSRERAWLAHLVARYAALPNLFLWTLANEYETRPDSRHRLDLPEDLHWVRDTARWVKALDAWRHPVTVHPVVSSSTHGQTPEAPFDPPWRIGGFFGADDGLDVLSQQTGQAGRWDATANRFAGAPGTWSETEGCWTQDEPLLAASIAADRRYGKPVLNTENGYEYLRGYPDYRRQVHHTDKVRRNAWRIVCAGGYAAAGFAGTLAMNDFWNQIENTGRYTFQVRDEGAAGQLAHLYDFFTGLPFWQLEPVPATLGQALVTRVPGLCYVLYLPCGGEGEVALDGDQGTYHARWFDPRTGRYGDPWSLLGGQTHRFSAPDARDWVLRIHRVSP